VQRVLKEELVRVQKEIDEIHNRLDGESGLSVDDKKSLRSRLQDLEFDEEVRKSEVADAEAEAIAEAKNRAELDQGSRKPRTEEEMEKIRQQITINQEREREPLERAAAEELMKRQAEIQALKERISENESERTEDKERWKRQLEVEKLKDMAKGGVDIQPWRLTEEEKRQIDLLEMRKGSKGDTERTQTSLELEQKEMEGARGDDEEPHDKTDSVPMFIKVSRDQIDVETLRHFGLPWELDPVGSPSVLTYLAFLTLE
jgi:hypothetical protein